jgi:hypothetical protein
MHGAKNIKFKLKLHIRINYEYITMGEGTLLFGAETFVFPFLFKSMDIKIQITIVSLLLYTVVKLGVSN